MREYEVMVIFDPDTEERTVQPTLEKHLKVITKVAARSTTWISGDGGAGVRNLEEVRGIYAVINVTAEPATSKSWIASSLSTSQSCGPRSSGPICTEPPASVGIAPRRTEKEPSRGDVSSASDDDGGGYNARCASRAHKGARLSTDCSAASA